MTDTGHSLKCNHNAHPQLSTTILPSTVGVPCYKLPSIMCSQNDLLHWCSLHYWPLHTCNHCTGRYVCVHCMARDWWGYSAIGKECHNVLHTRSINRIFTMTNVYWWFPQLPVFLLAQMNASQIMSQTCLILQRLSSICIRLQFQLLMRATVTPPNLQKSWLNILFGTLLWEHYSTSVAGWVYTTLLCTIVYKIM